MEMVVLSGALARHRYSRPPSTAYRKVSVVRRSIFIFLNLILVVLLVTPQFWDSLYGFDESVAGSEEWIDLPVWIPYLGAFIGAINLDWIAGKFSRKYSMLFAVSIFTAGNALQSTAIDYPMLVIARLITGVGNGMLSLVVPLYAGEISPPETRTRFLLIEGLVMIGSFCAAFAMGYGMTYLTENLSEESWCQPVLFQILPGCLLAFGVLAFLPFSPRWLVAKGRIEEARAVIAKLQRQELRHSDVTKELIDIRAEVAYHREVKAIRHPNLQGDSLANRINLESASYWDCFRARLWWRAHVAVGMMFFNQFVGNYALLYYAPALSMLPEFDENTQTLLSYIPSTAQFVGVALTIWAMGSRRLGRRTLLLVASFFMTITGAIITILVWLFSDDWPSHREWMWTTAAFSSFFMLLYGASWGPIPWVVSPEVFPSSLRGKAMAMDTGFYWIISLAVRCFTPPFVDSTGYVAFSFFTGFCGLSIVWTYIFVPETADRTLAEIDKAFRDTSGAEETDRRQKITDELMKLEGLEMKKESDAKRQQGDQGGGTRVESPQMATANPTARSTGRLVISTMEESGESTMVATQTNSPQETIVGTDRGQ